MDPNTGRTYDLSMQRDIERALHEGVQELRSVDQDEVIRLQMMNRADRRKALLSHDKVTRAQLTEMLKKAGTRK